MPIDHLPDLDPCWEDDGPFKLGPRRVKLSDRLDLLPAPEHDANTSLEPSPPTKAQRRRMLRAAAMRLVRRAGFTIEQCAAAFGVSRAGAWKVLTGVEKTVPCPPGSRTRKNEASRHVKGESEHGPGPP